MHVLLLLEGGNTCLEFLGVSLIVMVTLDLKLKTFLD
jgi:hypothetical protein